MTIEFSIECLQEVATLLCQEMPKLAQLSETRGIAAIENGLRQGMHQVGKYLLQQWLGMGKEKYPTATRPCGCGGEAGYQRCRAGKVLTVFGWISYERSYYLCPDCHTGHYPLDQRLGLEPGQVSAGLSPLLALLGIQTSFAEASERLAEELLLVQVSENTIRQETQEMGMLQMEIEGSHIQESLALNLPQVQAQSDAPGCQRRYGSLDGTHIPVDKEWRELKVGCWYDVAPSPLNAASSAVVGQTPPLMAQNITYYCDMAQAATLAPLLWATGCQRQAHLTPEVVFVADGAAWIWNLVTSTFPQATQIVDWYHAAEYLPPIAKAAFADTNQQTQWLTARRQDLWDGQIDLLITACEALESLPAAAPAAAAAATYYFNNKHRLDYARFRAEGYHIGSGTMESGCKQIATQRLKRSGARWTQSGALTTAKARAAWLSGQWHTLCQRRHALPLAV